MKLSRSIKQTVLIWGLVCPNEHADRVRSMYNRKTWSKARKRSLSGKEVHSTSIQRADLFCALYYFTTFLPSFYWLIFQISDSCLICRRADILGIFLALRTLNKTFIKKIE